MTEDSTEIRVGDLVWTAANNRFLPQGGPRYRARVEELRDGRAKVRPLTVAITEATARAAGRRAGPSVRARWVTAEHLTKALADQ